MKTSDSDQPRFARRLTKEEAPNSIRGESLKAFDAFCIYRDMGEERSIRKANALTGKCVGYVRQLENWSRHYHWVDRAAEHDNYMAEQELKATLRDKLKARDNRRKALMAVLVKSVQHLDAVPENEVTFRDRVEGVRMSVQELRKEYDEEPEQHVDLGVSLPGTGAVMVYLPDNNRPKAEAATDQDDQG